MLYAPDGTVAHKRFNKHVVSDTQWRYEAWFATGADYYLIENVPAGYKVRYENVGLYADVTDRCHNGGTIINYKIPKTGDDSPLEAWIAALGLGIAGVGVMVFLAVRNKKRRK